MLAATEIYMCIIVVCHRGFGMNEFAMLPSPPIASNIFQNAMPLSAAMFC